MDDEIVSLNLGADKPGTPKGINLVDKLNANMTSDESQSQQFQKQPQQDKKKDLPTVQPRQSNLISFNDQLSDYDRSYSKNDKFPEYDRSYNKRYDMDNRGRQNSRDNIFQQDYEFNNYNVANYNIRLRYDNSRQSSNINNTFPHSNKRLDMLDIKNILAKVNQGSNNQPPQ